MKSEYQKSLDNWARNLSDEQLSEYLLDDRLSGPEFDAVMLEDIRRGMAGYGEAGL